LPRVEKLRSLLASFQAPISPILVKETLEELQEEYLEVSLLEPNSEEETLRFTALGAVAASLYGHVFDVLLQQAAEADAEANW